MTPAQEIMNIIKETGWSQRKLAKFLDIGANTVTRWSNQAKQDSGKDVAGECASPHPHTLRLLRVLLADGEAALAAIRIVELEARRDRAVRVLQGGE
jgi:DNA-binding transcriptional regulator YiaG